MNVLKRLLRVGSSIVAVAALLAPAVAHAATVSITEYPIATGTGTQGIASGPDGNLWITENYNDRIVKLTPGGSFTEYGGITSGSNPGPITVGPDGNLWFTEHNGNKIGKITTAGTLTEYTVTTSGSEPGGITPGPDGNLWFTEGVGNKIGKITPTGTITEYPVTSSASVPSRIVTGPDNNLWFTEFSANKIGMITTSGVVSEFTIPTTSSQPQGIAVGSDNNLWFTESNKSKIGRLTTSGIFTEYTTPTSSSTPLELALGPDGNLWFTESIGNKIGRISPAGAITEYPITSTGASAAGITKGPDNNMWFAELAKGQAGKVTLSTDWDDDGIANDVESGAPNTGDANNDGVPDNKQTNVTSILNSVTGTYTVLESDCANNSSVSMAPASANSASDGGYTYPLGFMSFSLACATGTTANITQYYYTATGTNGLVVRKFNSTTKQYQNIPGAVISQVTIGGRTALKVVYQITDGGILDQDGASNGIIVDPVGLGTTAVAPPNTGIVPDPKQPKTILTLTSFMSAAMLVGGLRLRRSYKD